MNNISHLQINSIVYIQIYLYRCSIFSAPSFTISFYHIINIIIPLIHIISLIHIYSYLFIFLVNFDDDRSSLLLYIFFIRLPIAIKHAQFVIPCRSTVNHILLCMKVLHLIVALLLTAYIIKL